MKNTFEEICEELKIDWVSEEPKFQAAWSEFKGATRRANRGLSYKECLFLWLLVRKLNPRALLELGGQYGHSGIILFDAVKLGGGKFITVELGDDPRNKYESPGTLEFLPDNDPQLEKVWGDAHEKLPGILENNPIDMVFHDCDHTWEHVEKSVTMVLNHNPGIVQLAHDCGEGMWQPTVERIYGYVCAERPIFDKYFLNNPEYFYRILEDKYGLGMAIPYNKLLS
jgi:hypothetical protein